MFRALEYLLCFQERQIFYLTKSSPFWSKEKVNNLNKDKRIIIISAVH